MLPKILKRAKKAPKEALEVPKPTKNLSPKGSLLHSLNQSLGTVFYLVWILIGLFLILSVIFNIRENGFKSFFNSSTPTPSTEQQGQTQTEATIPGIGRVKIDCVLQSVSQETLGKIQEKGNTSTLTKEEKAEFEPCIVEKETPTPSVKPSPTPSPKPTS